MSIDWEDYDRDQRWAEREEYRVDMLYEKKWHIHKADHEEHHDDCEFCIERAERDEDDRDQAKILRHDVLREK